MARVTALKLSSDPLSLSTRLHWDRAGSQVLLAQSASSPLSSFPGAGISAGYQADGGSFISTFEVLLGQEAGEHWHMGRGGEGRERRKGKSESHCGQLPNAPVLPVSRLKVELPLPAPWWSSGAAVWFSPMSGKRKQHFHDRTVHRWCETFQGPLSLCHNCFLDFGSVVSLVSV